MHVLGHACACITPPLLQLNPSALLPLRSSARLLPRGTSARELSLLRKSSACVALRKRASNELRVLVMATSSNNGGIAEPTLSSNTTSTSTSTSPSGVPPSPATPAILIFTVPACRYCRQAKALLASNGLPYTECSVALDNPAPPPAAAAAAAAAAAGDDAAPLASSSSPASPSAVISAAAARAALAEASGMRTVPVIYVGGRLVGGFDDLEQLVTSKKLQELLASPADPLPPALIPLLSLKPAADSSADSPGDAATARGAGGREGGLAVWPGLSRELVELFERMAAGEGEGGVRREEVKDGLLTTHRNVVSGAAIVAWLKANMPTGEEEGEGTVPAAAAAPAAASSLEAAAVRVAERLAEADLVHHITYSQPFTNKPDVFFRLLPDELPESTALNARPIFLRPARPASVVASGLRAATVGIYDEALSLDGGGVSYKRLASSAAFKEYVRAAAELQKVDVLALPLPHRKAFWINIYNSLVLHATLALGPPSSPLDRKRFFSHSSYLIAGHSFSLDDIEHGILRGNRATIGLPFFPGKRPFGGSDLRRFYSLPPADPRIHFALNCGARSCPPIRLFSGDAIESELDTAAGAFLEGDVRVVEDGGKSGGKEKVGGGGGGGEVVLQVTKLLDWYGVDFGAKEEEQVRWILPYLKAQVRAQVEGALAAGKAVRLQFRPYDWTSNSL